MKKKLTLCFLVFALILTCANAMAAKIGGANSENASGATVEKQSDQTVKVTYAGQKDKEYVVMAVAQSGVDSSAGRPTKETIGNNQSGVVVYMDQTKGNSDGTVEFTIRPNLEQAKAGEEYFIYISSNAANSAMTKIGSFTVDGADPGDSGDSGDSGTTPGGETTYQCGDVNHSGGKPDNRDVRDLARYVGEWEDYMEGGSKAIDLSLADVNGSGGKPDNRDVRDLARYVGEWAGYDSLPYQK